MLLKEYRICMPLSVAEYKIGQLYMIAKHSREQSSNGEGVEVIKNEPCEDPEYGKGQYTEKRVHLSSRLPYWVQSVTPKIFYITEKAWNFYPHTITENLFKESPDFLKWLYPNRFRSGTKGFARISVITPFSEYTCSFIPRFSVHIETRYEDNKGTTENCVNLSDEDLEIREVDMIDIVLEEVPEKHYKEEENLTEFKSKKTGRGPLGDGWTDKCSPIMCSYKVVKVNFDFWGLQTKVENFTHRSVRDILLLGHRQAFAWIDEWIDMTVDDIRCYEANMQKETNQVVQTSLEREKNKQ